MDFLWSLPYGFLILCLGLYFEVRMRRVMADLPCKAETTLLGRLGMLLDSMAQRVELLQDALHREAECGDWVSKADCIRDVVLPQMNALRAVCDEAETLTDAKAWPFPTYGELLFGVK